MSLTRYEKSRLTFCRKQNAILKRRYDKAVAALSKKHQELEDRVEFARQEYEANTVELEALEEKVADANSEV